MSVVLGLDVSTSVVGVCVVDSQGCFSSGKHVMLINSIELKSGSTIWHKADVVASALRDIVSLAASNVKIVEHVAIEEPLMGFRPGMSSALTISTLMRFNGIVSYISRGVFEVDPVYIGSAHARKLCGVKVQRTAVAGPQKAQVFNHMSAADLKHVTWPRKKNGDIAPRACDSCDAYVIAWAHVVNMQQNSGTIKESAGKHLVE